ncbi:hypothetical protein WKI68_16025 [Streptomyces sp. MS1.HAVA.3]|uniref:Uncharacterized protein n=1 Tax=Streptomyces caledonius TaxID=3134107 RepID=A0ABU8U3R7_9ACTN
MLERLARPRAALDAYRSALELWTRSGEGAEGGEDGQGVGGAESMEGAEGAEGAEGTQRHAQRHAEALRAKVRALEAGL